MNAFDILRKHPGGEPTHETLDAVWQVARLAMTPGVSYSAQDVATLCSAPWPLVSMALRRAALGGAVKMRTAFDAGRFTTAFLVPGPTGRTVPYRPKGGVIELVQRALRGGVPLTTAQLADRVGKTPAVVHGVIVRARRRAPEQVIRVAGRDDRGCLQWAVGPGADAVEVAI